MGINKQEIKKFSKTIFKLVNYLAIILLIAGFFIFVLNKSGIIERVNSVDKIRSLVDGGGVYSSLIFVLLQILQTTILQFPSAVVTIAGVVALGAKKAFLLSFISIMIGSIIMFFVGRLAGKKFLYLLLGKDKADKLVALISEGKYAFFIMMVFPFFPDDILCSVAGVGDMHFSYFLFTNIIARLIGIAGCVYLGDSLLNLRRVNLFIWILLGMVSLVSIILVIKNKNKLDELFNKLRQKNILKKKK